MRSSLLKNKQESQRYEFCDQLRSSKLGTSVEPPEVRCPLLDSPMNESDATPNENSDDRPQRDLSADIHFLGDLLGGTIRRLGGEEAFVLVEEVRAAAKALRVRHSLAEARKLRDRLRVLDVPARALSSARSASISTS